MKTIHYCICLLVSLLVSCKSTENHYDLIIRNGTVYDGSGGAPMNVDIAIKADTITFIGDLKNASATKILDAKGLAVAPGFINMLSWANESLIADGNSESDIRQGVTLEVMGEGESMGPLSKKMQQQIIDSQGDIKYPVEWTTLGGYFQFLEKKGISPNVASFVGATTIRQYVLDEVNRAPTPAELDTMRALVRQAMEEGAMGVGTSLIYPPAFFAKTDELIALCKEAAKYQGGYISHIRSEGNKLHEAVEELITIGREAGIHAEIYHLKAAGKDNWSKMDSVIRRVERARKEGLDVSANMYTYTAGGTGLSASMPPELQDGGFGELRKRLQDPAIRAKTIDAMRHKSDKWENLYYATGSPEKVLLVGFKQDSLKKYTGKSLKEIAIQRGAKSPEDAAIDLIIADSTRVGTIYFLMNEDNVRRQVALPWVSFGSDEGSYKPEGVFLKSNAHPRAYGNFARVLGQYCREEKLLTLSEAIRKLAALPAQNLKLVKRGMLKTGYYADLAIFNPAQIKDHATFEKPHQFSTGMVHVVVNGVPVLENGNHTGAKPGRFVRGAGYKHK
jgi:N-acyl-D-amino-acid deacylase